jgi:hypothetical protein
MCWQGHDHRKILQFYLNPNIGDADRNITLELPINPTPNIFVRKQQQQQQQKHKT